MWFRLTNLSLLHSLQSVNEFHPTYKTRPISQTLTQELPSEPFLGRETVRCQVSRQKTSKQKREEPYWLYAHCISNGPVIFVKPVDFSTLMKINSRYSLIAFLAHFRAYIYYQYNEHIFCFGRKLRWWKSLFHKHCHVFTIALRFFIGRVSWGFFTKSSNGFTSVVPSLHFLIPSIPSKV